MRLQLIVLFLLFTNTLTAQVNYVRNPGFEIYSKCPYNAEQIRLASGWTPIDSTSNNSDSMGNGVCNPEYCNECSSQPISRLPDNFYFHQYAHSGKGLASVYMYVVEPIPSIYPYYRDYLQGRLIRKLTAGKSYCVTFYVNLEEGSGYAIKEISAYLDNGSIDTTVYCGLPQSRYTPQVSNTGGVISDTANWTKIQGSFIANGTEQFITIGNFRTMAQTTAVAQPPNSYSTALQGTKFAYYVVDDVSVIESNLPADAGADRHIALGDSTYIGRANEVGLECSWTILGSSTVIGTGAGMWVKPTTTTSYVVSQTLCGITKKDTVRVDVWKLGVTSINGKTQHYSLSPNPAGNIIQLQQELEDNRPVSVGILDATGRTVYYQTCIFSNSSIEIGLSSLTAGLYYMNVRDGYGTAYNMRFVKQ